MRLKLFSHCGCDGQGGKVYDCGGYDYIVFVSRWFQLRWFDDNGCWFAYIHIGRRWWRFSEAGFMRGGG